MSYANVVNKAVGIRFRLPRLLLLCLLLLHLHSQFLGLSRKLLILIDVLLFFPSPAATSNDSGRAVVVVAVIAVELLLLLLLWGYLCVEARLPYATVAAIAAAPRANKFSG